MSDPIEEARVRSGPPKPDSSSTWEVVIGEGQLARVLAFDSDRSRAQGFANGYNLALEALAVLRAERDILRRLVEKYGRVWAKDSDYYEAAEALGIEPDGDPSKIWGVDDPR